MQCKKCKIKLADNAIYCPECGTETTLLDTGLAFRSTLTEVHTAIESRHGAYGPLTLLLTFAVILPAVAVLVIGFAGLFPAVGMLSSAWIGINMAALLFLPLLLLPLAAPEGYLTAAPGPRAWLGLFKHYPKALVFVLLNILYYFVLKVVCTGQPFYSYAYDPILNLVQLVMMFYWLAVVIPVPQLMFHYGYNPLKAIKIAYNAGKQTRWQQFYITTYIMLWSLVGVLTLGIMMVSKLPHFYGLLEVYTRRMQQYGLLNKKEDSQ